MRKNAQNIGAKSPHIQLKNLTWKVLFMLNKASKYYSPIFVLCYLLSCLVFYNSTRG